MTIEAKRAAKLEKKLRTLLGGYQVSLPMFLNETNRVLDQLILVSWSSTNQSIERCL